MRHQTAVGLNTHRFNREAALGWTHDAKEGVVCGAASCSRLHQQKVTDSLFDHFKPPTMALSLSPS